MIQAIGYNFGVTSSTPPGTPSISTAVSGSDVTVTIDGDASVTNYLLYKAAGDAAWTAGGNRAGDGDIVVSSLDSGVEYLFGAYSESDTGSQSTMSPVQTVTIAADSASEVDPFDVQNALIQLQMSGESVVYVTDGGERPILALIDRQPVSGVDGVRGTSSKTILRVANSSTSGISINEINKKTDKIRFAVKLGETPQERRITGNPQHNAGMVVLEIR